MKKIIVWLLVCMLMLGMTACSGDNNPTEPATEPPTEEVTEPVDERDLKQKAIDFAKEILPKIYPILPYLDVVAAVMLMGLSGAIIVLVLIMKRRK